MKVLVFKREWTEAMAALEGSQDSQGELHLLLASAEPRDLGLAMVLDRRVWRMIKRSEKHVNHPYLKWVRAWEFVAALFVAGSAVRLATVATLPTLLVLCSLGLLYWANTIKESIESRRPG
jgi:hypothetical protein